jgi:starch phosphorylase
MKLLPNGGLNFSILDGWWDEGYERDTGWAIGRDEEYPNEDAQDQVESQALYNTLENDIVPLYYDRDDQEIPRRWVAKMKASMKKLTPVFHTNRMVAEYTENFYIPAHERHLRLSADGAKMVMPLVEWRRRIRGHGSEVRILNSATNAPAEMHVGARLRIEARVALGEIRPDDVRVQIYYGNVDASGKIVKGVTTDMVRAGSEGTEHTYRGELECHDSGSCGFSVRVVPYHHDAILPYELPWIVWAE